MHDGRLAEGRDLRARRKLQPLERTRDRGLLGSIVRKLNLGHFLGLRGGEQSRLKIVLPLRELLGRKLGIVAFGGPLLELGRRAVEAPREPLQFRQDLHDLVLADEFRDALDVLALRHCEPGQSHGSFKSRLEFLGPFAFVHHGIGECIQDRLSDLGVELLGSGVEFAKLRNERLRLARPFGEFARRGRLDSTLQRIALSYQTR